MWKNELAPMQEGPENGGMAMGTRKPQQEEFGVDSLLRCKFFLWEDGEGTFSFLGLMRPPRYKAPQGAQRAGSRRRTGGA